MTQVKGTLELWQTDELLRLAACGGGFKIDGRPRGIQNLARRGGQPRRRRV